MPAPGGRKQRSSVACDFCRRRKLGCNNTRPSCENCQLHNVDCTYTRRTQRLRPSNARISRLEEENERLRNSLRLQSSAHTGQQPQTSESWQPSKAASNGAGSQIPSLAPEDDSVFSSQRTSHHVLSVNHAPILTETASLPFPSNPLNPTRNDSFHGPASALFEERPSVTQCALIDSTTKDRLVANASRQRQLETLNFQSGKLDFDGTDPDLGMLLLSAYWNRQHYAGTVVYRPTFMRDMACQGPYYSKLLLNAILFAASKLVPSVEVRSNVNEIDTAGRPFRHKFDMIIKESGPSLLYDSEITTIQALLVVADVLFSWCDETSLSWHYAGLAISMIVDLGIHVDRPCGSDAKAFSVEAIEVRRRLFWSAFALDKVQSIYQGRPARLREADQKVPIEFLDDFTELELFNTIGYTSPPQQLDRLAHSVSSFEQVCKLSIIMDRILSNLYSEQTSLRDPAYLLRTAQQLHSSLKFWRDDLPEHLVIGSRDLRASKILPHTLSLMAMYNSLIILLHRPFVSDGHLQTASASAANDAFTHCATAAQEIYRITGLYKTQFCLKTVPYFVSYATYVSATIHARIAAQRPVNSDAHMCLRHCLGILNEHQTICHAPRRTLKALLELVQRLKVDIGELPEIRSSHCTASQSEVDGSRPDRSAQPQLPDHAIPETVSLTSPLLETWGIDFDPVLADFDIEGIMKTFDTLSSDSMQGDTVVGLQSGMSINGSGELYDNVVPTRNAQTIDPLVGLDNIFM